MPRFTSLAALTLAAAGTAFALAAAPASPASPTAAHVATNLKSFEGIEEPTVRYDAAAGRFLTDDGYINITDRRQGTVRMTLRVHAAGPDGNGGWWDGDRATKNKDRQRAEVKGLGPHQKDGDTFEYATTWRTDPAMHGTNRFCHVFQLKATDGDKGAPLVTLSVLNGVGHAAVRFWPGDSKNFKMVRAFDFKPGQWQTVRIRIRTDKNPTGAISVSVNGDAWQGVENVPVFRPDAADYRPKWGFYRGISRDMNLPAEDWVEHKDASARKL